MSVSRKLARVALMGLVGGAIGLPGLAQATNGYFSHGYGMKSKGVAGAGVANPTDAMDAASNPANMVFVGSQWLVGASLFSPRREYSVSGAPTGFPMTFGLVPGSFDSDSNLFIIPNFAYNKMLSDDSSFGVTVYGNGGMNTDWSASKIGGGIGTYGAGDAGVDLAQLFINLSYARKFAGGKAAWGVSGILAYQRFKADGLTNFGNLSNDPAQLTNNGHDGSFGGGIKIGLVGEVAPGVRLGGSYQSKMYMNKFDKYSGLFAEEGGFDIPQTATLGLAWDATPAVTVMFDAQWIGYSGIDSVGNNMGAVPGGHFFTCATRMAPTDPNCLGGASGIGFGWEDMWIFKLGAQIKGGNGWTWRVGASTVDQQPIPSSEVMFNILAPGVMKHHVTFGFTKELSKTSGIDFAAMYAPSHSVSGPNPLEAPGAQNIEIKMYQYELGIQYYKKF